VEETMNGLAYPRRDDNVHPVIEWEKIAKLRSEAIECRKPKACDDCDVCPTTADPLQGRNIAILIRCACGNSLELNPDISHGATNEWTMITHGILFRCHNCGEYVHVHELHAIDLSRYGSQPCTPS
jgi:hypothetical protein